MMIGCDIVAISRIEKIFKLYNKRFLNKFLNQNEQNIIKNISSLAGFYAAKEAFSKALGVGISKDFSFLDIEIYKNKKQAVKINISSKIKEKFKIKNSSLSIAHDGGFAIAIVIIQN